MSVLHELASLTSFQPGPHQLHATKAPSSDMLCKGKEELTMETAGTTFSRFGVKPLNKPLNPSPFNVCLVTSPIPVYVL